MHLDGFSASIGSNISLRVRGIFSLSLSLSSLVVLFRSRVSSYYILHLHNKRGTMLRPHQLALVADN